MASFARLYNLKLILLGTANRPSSSHQPRHPAPWMPIGEGPISLMSSNATNDSRTNVDQPFLARTIQPGYLQQDYQTPRDSTATVTEPLTQEKPEQSVEHLYDYRGLSDDNARTRDRHGKRSFWKRPLLYIPALLLLLIIIAAAVVIPIYFLVIKKNTSAAASTSSGSNSSTPTSGGGNNTSSTPTPSGAITGGDGSLVTTITGSTFVYNNSFGGFCKSNISRVSEFPESILWQGWLILTIHTTTTLVQTHGLRL